ncbi:MAG: D-alanyl-D-alanine carboxypeptidase, partial [Symbiobacteriaceae bacterium]|nr:D-alanyl-D-alanine carboxypeptidase [Symbiobacteriaceae bacterium]
MNRRAVVIVLIFSLFSTGFAAYASEPRISASSAFLLDYNTGQVLFAKEADEPVAMASLTKVMTMYVIFDAIKAGEIHLEHICVVSRKAYEVSQGTSRMWLYHGDVIIFEEILKGIAIVSGNDASVVAAEEICDSEEEFVVRMNAKAIELGMTATNYMNVHGLDEEGHYTTARDTAILGAALIRDHPESIEYLNMPELTYFSFPSIMYNTNGLLLSYEGADGIKTGTTDEAGFCLLGSA